MSALWEVPVEGSFLFSHSEATVKASLTAIFQIFTSITRIDLRIVIDRDKAIVRSAYPELGVLLENSDGRSQVATWVRIRCA